MKKDQGCKIAVIDDYASVAETLAAYIRHMGCVPAVFTNPLAFLDELKNTAFEIVITDLRMPQMDGISLLKKIRTRVSNAEIIVVSAHADKKDAIEALKYGAYDFFEKPVGEAELVATIKRTLAYKEALQQRDTLARRISIVTDNEAKKWGIKAFIGESAAMEETLSKIRLLRKSRKTNVLILGESGTGKELVARAIHFESDRAEAPFIAVNCAAIPDDLAESILFGHVKGSFTGATSDRKGQFELADGGTLFLDEIGDMSPRVQTKLLRVLEDGIVTPVGKAGGNRVDVRVVSATNTNLQEKIASGRFRLDLSFRLSGYTVMLAPLRDKKKDIPLLAEYFAQELSSEMGIPAKPLGSDVLAVLEQHDYPGNIRELKNIIERALIESGGNTLKPEHIYFSKASCAAPLLKEQELTFRNGDDLHLPLDLKATEEETICKAMTTACGNISAAARLLGVSRPKLYRKLAQMNG